MNEELSVLLRPAESYALLVKTEGRPAWQRPAMFALVFGCVVSLASSGRVTLRLAGPAAIYAGLIPLVEAAVLRVLLRRNAKPSLGRAVDLFFLGHAAWSLWLLAVGAIFAFLDPMRAFVVTGWPWGMGSLLLVVGWSAYTDWCFFRCVSPDRAARNLAVQRAVCWTIGLAIFGGGSFWTGLRGILGK